MNNSFNTVAKALVYTIIVFVILLYYSPRLLGVLMAGLLSLIFVGGLLRKTTSKLNRQYLEEKSRLVAISEETFSNIRTVKAFANSRTEVRKFDEIN